MIYGILNWYSIVRVPVSHLNSQPSRMTVDNCIDLVSSFDSEHNRNCFFEIPDIMVALTKIRPIQVPVCFSQYDADLTEWTWSKHDSSSLI